jgi:hypothetical protein
VGRFGGPVPIAGGLPLVGALPLVVRGRVGLCEENDDAGVATDTRPGDDSLDDVEDRSRNEAVDESRSLEGILDCEFVEGEK